VVDVPRPYTLAYTPTTSGMDNVVIPLSGAAISGLHSFPAVRSSDLSAGQSTAVVPNGTAGSVTTITVQAKDANGNNLTTGGATVAAAVSGANTATPAVVDNGDGTYTLTYTPTTSGTDNVAITLNGNAISGSPYSSIVV